MIDPRYRHMKANMVPPNSAQSAPRRRVGAFGGPPRRNGFDALKILGATLQDLDGSMGYGHRDYAMDGIRDRNARMEQDAANAERQAKLSQLAGSLPPGMAPLMELAPNAVLPELVKQQFAQPQTLSPADQLAREKFEYEKKVGKEERMQGPETPWYITENGVDPRYVQAQQAGRDQVNVTTNLPSQGGNPTINDFAVSPY